VDVHFIAPVLRQIDEASCDAAWLPLFADERPLRGALGQLDWRLCGVISELLMRGEILGREGEQVLVPGRPKLPVDKLFLYGLGESSSFSDARFEEAAQAMLETLSLAKVRACLCVLPGRHLDLIAPPRAMELFLRASNGHERPDEITLLEEPEAQRQMVPVMERERHKARARSF